VEVPVPLTATIAGTAEVRLRLEFFACSPAWCVRQERQLALPVAVVGGRGP
jgi:hypothetical protein